MGFMRVCIWGEAVRFGNGLTSPADRFPIWVYHSLPNFSHHWRIPLVDLVWSTILYHVRGLGQTFWSLAFTNHYHRDEGLTIELSIVHQVAGW